LAILPCHTGVGMPMLIEYFNGCACASSLGIAAQIKIIEEPLLVFIGLYFGIYLGPPSEKYKIVSWKKKKSLNTSKIC
jgi:hypothetical protein